ncbi:MAG: Crossover junction endodeoxyribonuclease RuvC [Myxococcaceae bacterium]|nr:Crossover junction endodeoxyribonuclease RuvC [Myxococcaceae bacterium]
MRRARQPAFVIPALTRAARPGASVREAGTVASRLRVLGIDPGSVRTGWGVVERTGQTARGIAAGVIRISERASLGERLEAIHRGITEVLLEHKPDAVAIEDIFFAKYAQAALMLGHARGVALLAAAQAGHTVAAYPPSVVKRAVVGSGRAEKTQVAQLVGALLGLKELPGIDATDALAIALTHLNVCRIGV